MTTHNQNSDIDINQMAPKLLSESDKSNPTALGDPVSLKAENSDSSPTDQYRSRANLAAFAPSPTEGDLSKSDGQDDSKKSLKDSAKRDLHEAVQGNRSMLGDLVSLKAETTARDPIKDDGLGGLTDNMKRDSKL